MPRGEFERSPSQVAALARGRAANPRTRLRSFRELRVPPTGSPVVRRLFELMNQERIGILDMADRAGWGDDAIRSLRQRGTTSTLAMIEAMLGVLGYRLAVVEQDHDDRSAEVAYKAGYQAGWRARRYRARTPDETDERKEAGTP